MTPFSTWRPAAAASSVLGVIPTPTRTMSASIRLPSLSMTPVTDPFLPVSSATATWQRRSTPCVTVQVGKDGCGLRAEDAQ